MAAHMMNESCLCLMVPCLLTSILLEIAENEDGHCTHTNPKDKYQRKTSRQIVDIGEGRAENGKDDAVDGLSPAHPLFICGFSIYVQK